jgi:hypothetical protein
MLSVDGIAFEYFFMAPKRLQTKVAGVVLLDDFARAIDIMAMASRRQEDGDIKEPMHRRLGDMVASSSQKPSEE